jgi:3-hydroxyisobutyrate dehydrogenase/2-hydroxy-3-oxopropionate reductase
MGAAMTARLRGAGFAVTLFNRTRARAEGVAADTRSAVAEDAASAGAAADVVIVSLADDAAVRAVYAGPGGLAAGLRPGAVVLDTSTVDPQTVREVEPLVTGRGARLLDAPVSGSVAVVEAGALTVMVGGDVEALDVARPVLEPLAARVVHLGPLGSGAVMKLAVNALLLGLNQSLAEALVLAERAGVDRETAYDVFMGSAAGAPFLGYKREAFLHPEARPPAFVLDLVAKDLGLVQTLADRVGARMDQLAVNRDVVAGAVAGGMGEQDMSALAQWLRR